MGIDDSVTKGFLPVDQTENRISILGRTVILSETGLPESINSFFGPSNQSLIVNGQPVVARPFRFIIEKENGQIVSLVPGKLSFIEKTPSKVLWEVPFTSSEFDLALKGQMEFDGYIDYSSETIIKKPVQD